jgi:putative restriction endonuclease
MDDNSVRQATFGWLDEQTETHGFSLSRSVLAQGFQFQGEHIRLVGPQGIFKPRCLNLPLSITSVAGGPYADAFRTDGLLSYRYRGTDPQHRDNVRQMKNRLCFISKRASAVCGITAGLRTSLGS